MLPDNKTIVFQLGAATDFSGGNVGIDPIAGFSLGGLFGGGGGGMAPTTAPSGNLFVLDLASGKEVILAKVDASLAVGLERPAHVVDPTAIVHATEDAVGVSFNLELWPPWLRWGERSSGAARGSSTRRSMPAFGQGSARADA